MSAKKVVVGDVGAEPSYEMIVVDEILITVVSVIWKDSDGNILVQGEQLVSGDVEAAEKVAKVFAGDLKKNFAHRFPLVEAEPEPEPEEVEK